ncbi:MAG: TSUP family transporter [Sulfuricellaceae bacterium]
MGGGAIIAPFCITIFRLPVHVVAGAALAGTFATSVIGVAAYTFLPLPGGGSAVPDWWLGSLFGLGGLGGMYLGAACQKHIPQRMLKGALGILLAGLGGAYVVL